MFDAESEWSVKGKNGYWIFHPVGCDYDALGLITGVEFPTVERVTVRLFDPDHVITFYIQARWSLFRWDLLESGLSHRYLRVEEVKARQSKAGTGICSFSTSIYQFTESNII
jgi:hypothetical protein